VKRREPQTVADLDVGDVFTSGEDTLVMTMVIGGRPFVRLVEPGTLRDASEPFEVYPEHAVDLVLRGQAYYKARSMGGADSDPLKGG
jgi:hypothetical protein